MFDLSWAPGFIIIRRVGLALPGVRSLALAAVVASRELRGPQCRRVGLLSPSIQYASC